MTPDLSRRLVAEAIGTAALLACVVGSGIMAEALSGGNTGLALLANAVATGAILYVLILTLGPVSGAHFNPAVTLAFAARREISLGVAALFIAAQVIAGLIGVGVAHAMFDLQIVQIGVKAREGVSQHIAEVVATFGLLMTIFGGLRWRPEAVPMLVGLYITAAYWFTASTSFANPAVTIARSFTDSFAGIAPDDAPAFIIAQLIGAGLAVLVGGWLFSQSPPQADR